MAYLLDTHVLIWLLEADPSLPNSLVELIEDSNNDLFISTASLWEMTIKVSLGKLELSKSLEEIFTHLNKISIKILPIQPNHLLSLEHLPFHHRDPFDRIIISQCINEQIILISRDSAFHKYEVNCIWE